MKPFTTKLFLFLNITILLAVSQYPLTHSTKNSEKYRYKDYQPILPSNYQPTFPSYLLLCKDLSITWTDSMPFNYLGSSFVSSNRQRFTFCPGDALGDLNNTYLIVKHCGLEMYHKEKLLWSTEDQRRQIRLESQEDCGLFLQQNGNLELYYGYTYQSGQPKDEIYRFWTSRTNFDPVKTELRVQDQQFQILQTFKDGNQVLFYLDGTQPTFKEHLPGLIKVGSSGLIKSHSDNNTFFLRRNEYIGDLDGLHLILQADCDLHLKNQNRTIWSFELPIEERTVCSLITNTLMQTLMIPHSFQILESQFILKDDQLSIIQTLQDGSKLTFESQAGSNYALKMKKTEKRQIAKNNVTITQDGTPFVIERMDYIGNLTGLHLILQDNCTLMLINGQEKLWELPKRNQDPAMECSVAFFSNGSRFSVHDVSRSSGLESWYNNQVRPSFDYLGFSDFRAKELQLVLNNSLMIVTVIYNDNTSKEFYAGQNTHGRWSRKISEKSIIVKAQDKHDFEFPSENHIGNLNGVYVMLKGHCNLVLYDRNRLLWESNTPKPKELCPCSLYLKRNGNLEITYTDIVGYGTWGEEIYKKRRSWSTVNTTKNTGLSKMLVTSELSIDKDWLWLTNTYKDGTVQKFKALEGTNNFTRDSENLKNKYLDEL